MDALDAIAESIALHAGWLEEAREKNAPGAPIQSWARRIKALEKAAEELKQLRAWAEPIPAKHGDLSDLPRELIAQLSGAKTDKVETQIYMIVKAADDEIELDRILIELYRRHGVVYERKALNNKAYRMVQKGLIHQAHGRKGVYSIQPKA
jgi:hypothetical protein